MRASFVLALIAMWIHVAVFLQPLLPEKFQIAQVCITIAELADQTKETQQTSHHSHAKSVHDLQKMQHSDSEHKHSVDHRCIFCTVYGHLVAHLNLGIQEVFARMQVRMLAFQKAFKHVFFVLQRLFLTPQGRAPPLFA